MLTIYGKSRCPFCTKSTTYCKTNNLTYEYHSLDDFPSLRDIVVQAGMSTVPCIFDGENLIGGYTDLVTWHETNTMFD